MKNLLKMFFCTTLAVLSSVTAAQASWEIAEDDMVIINVEAGQEYAGHDVTFDVYAEGKTAEDVNGMNDIESLNVIVSREQDVLDENGSYSYIFGIAGNSGRYIAYITIEGMDEYIIEEIDFVNMTQFKTAIFSINDNLAPSPDYKAIGEIINENATSFGLVYEEYEKFNALKHESVAEIFVSMIEDDELIPEMRDDILNMIKKSIFVQSLNESKSAGVFENLNLSELDKSEIKDWYNKDFVMDSLKQDMTVRLMGKEFKSYDEYKKELVEAFVLATVRFPNGYKNVKEVIKAFAEEIGIEYGDNVSTNVWSGLAGKDFGNFDELCNAYKRLKSNTNSGASSLSAGGSSGGSKQTSKSLMYTELQNEPEQKVAAEDKKEMNFEDMSSEHWAHNAVKELYNKGIINGRSDVRFEPDGLITREEFVKLIVGCVDTQDITKEIPFKDVLKNSWYYDYIAKAYNSSIISGYSNEIFGVGDFITRQDMAVIAYKIFKMSDKSADQKTYESFADDADISDYAKESVYMLRNLGIVSGNPENEFSPCQFTTRAESAMIIYNLLCQINY